MYKRQALEALILGWALKLAPLIRMDEYKYRRLESKLTAAGLDMTPQVYTAYSILKPCLILLGIIPVSYTHLDVYKRQGTDRPPDGRRF